MRRRDDEAPSLRDEVEHMRRRLSQSTVLAADESFHNGTNSFANSHNGAPSGQTSGSTALEEEVSRSDSSTPQLSRPSFGSNSRSSPSGLRPPKTNYSSGSSNASSPYPARVPYASVLQNGCNGSSSHPSSGGSGPSSPLKYLKFFSSSSSSSSSNGGPGGSGGPSSSASSPGTQQRHRRLSTGSAWPGGPRSSSAPMARGEQQGGSSSAAGGSKALIQPRGHRHGERNFYMSEYQHVKKWAEPDYPPELSGAQTDRTHGRLGRPLLNDIHAKIAAQQAAAAQKSKERKGSLAAIKSGENATNVDKDAMFFAQISTGHDKHDVMPQPVPAQMRPDFSGRWLCSRVEGDWENYLRLLGVPESRRKMALSRGYGAGVAVQRVMMAPDRRSLAVSNAASAIMKGQDGSKFNPAAMLTAKSWVDGQGFSNQNNSTAKKRRASFEDIAERDPDVVVLKLDGSEQLVQSREGPKMVQRVGWEGSKVVTRHLITRPIEEGGPLKCVTRRSLRKAEGKPQDVEMVLEVSIGNFKCSRVFGQLDVDGDVVRNPKPPMIRVDPFRKKPSKAEEEDEANMTWGKRIGRFFTSCCANNNDRDAEEDAAREAETLQLMEEQRQAEAAREAEEIRVAMEQQQQQQQMQQQQEQQRRGKGKGKLRSGGRHKRDPTF